MIALARKEWRQLQPFAGVVVAASALAWMVLLDPRRVFVAPRADVQVPVWIGTLVAGAALGFWQVAGERGAGTLALLLQRPVPSRRVLAVKVAVGWLALALAGALPIALAWASARRGADGPALQSMRAVELVALTTAGPAGHGLGLLATTLKAPPRRQAAFVIVLVLGAVLPVAALWRHPWSSPTARVTLFAGAHLGLALALAWWTAGTWVDGADRGRPLPTARALALSAALLVTVGAPVVWLAALVESAAAGAVLAPYRWISWRPASGIVAHRPFAYGASASVLVPRERLPAVEAGEHGLCRLGGLGSLSWSNQILLALGTGWRVGERWRPLLDTGPAAARPPRDLVGAWLDQDTGRLRVVYLAPPADPLDERSWMRVAPAALDLAKPGGARFSNEVGYFMPEFFGAMPGKALLADAADGSLWEIGLDDPPQVLRPVPPPPGVLPSFGKPGPRDGPRYSWDGERWVPAPPIETLVPPVQSPFTVRVEGDPLRPRARVLDASGRTVLEHAEAPDTAARWVAWCLAQALTLVRPPPSLVAARALHSDDAPEFFQPALAPLVAGGRRDDLVVLSLCLAAGLAVRALVRLRRRGAATILCAAWPAVVLATGPVGYAVLALVEPVPEALDPVAPASVRPRRALGEEALA